LLAAVLGAAAAGCQPESSRPLEWNDAVVVQIEA
jgi:hypothetical protein